MWATFLTSLSIFAFGQPGVPVPAPKPKVPKQDIKIPKPDIKIKDKFELPDNWNVSRDSTEKYVTVDPNLNLNLCVNEGSLKVNGWNRNELRVFIKDGSQVGFVVVQRDPKSQAPTWIRLNGLTTLKNKVVRQTECVSGEEIELDVPVNAMLDIKGQEFETNIDNVNRALVTALGGDVVVRNVKNGVAAKTFRGDVTVENSKGSISIETTTGNIVVFEAGPSEIGDGFKAKTNSGTISLQMVDHRQMEVNSISGAIVYTGAIRNGGTYGFGTSNGAIRLSLPAATSCKVFATYGYGNFNSEVPMKTITDNIAYGPVRSIVGQLGNGGDASLKVATNSGNVSIKKQ